jgi:hypothetical protein
MQIVYAEYLSETYYSADSINEDDDPNHPAHENEATTDYLALLKHNGVPDHMLVLKPGAICTLMRNMSQEKGLVKNARLIVRRLARRFVEIQVINNRTGTLGETQCIPRITFNFKPPYCSWTVTRKQFPLRLSYAITFNGCAGLTLDRTVLDLRTDVFAHGQLYTALSRVRHRNDSRIFLNEEAESHEVVNVVYKELLL